VFGNGVASNATGNGLASGTSSRVYARCNWWGTAGTAGFRVGQASGGLFDASLYLTQDPYAFANPPCTLPSDPRRGAGGAAWATPGGPAAARGDSASALDRLDEAVGAATPAGAVGLLTALVADEPASAEAAAALGEAGGIAGRPGAPGSAVALLEGSTASPYGSLRVAAWQALVASRRATGDRVGALAAADALAAEGGAAVVQADLARVYLHAEGADTTAARAALASLEGLAPRSAEVGLARALLGLPGDEAPTGGRGAAAEAEGPEAGARGSAAVGVAGAAADPRSRSGRTRPGRARRSRSRWPRRRT